MDQNIINYKERTKLNRIDLVKDIPLTGPLSIHIEPTNVCNFKCTFCPESFSNYEDKAGGLFQLSLDDFNLIAEQLSTVPKIKQLNFFMMGEPLVNKNISKFIKIAKQRNLAEWYMISSNASLLTQEKYKDICESGLHYFRASIFGSNEELHNNRTQSKIKLSRVKDNLKNFQLFKKENGYKLPHTLVKMVDTGAAVENEEFIKDFTGLGDETLLEPLTNWNDAEEGDLSTVVSGSSNIKTKKDLMSSDHYHRKKKTCPYPFYSLVIHSDLNVSICCVDWEKKTLIGDLRKETLLDIWNGEKLREIQLKHIEGRKKDVEGCKNCTYHHTAKDNIDSLDVEEFKKRLKNKV